MTKKTATFYKTHPEARKKRLAYQKKYNQQEREVDKRVTLNRKNRESGTAGNKDNKDWSHTKTGLVLKPQSTNRASSTDAPGDRRARPKKR